VHVKGLSPETAQFSNFFGGGRLLLWPVKAVSSMDAADKPPRMGLRRAWTGHSSNRFPDSIKNFDTKAFKRLGSAQEPE
jgi:hypothetical protein